MKKKLKVVYVAPQYPNNNENAAQVRANILLPLLNDLIGLKVLGYPVGNNSVTLLEYEELKPSVSSLRLILATLLSLKPRSFSRFNSREALQKVADISTSYNADIIHLDTIANLVHVPQIKNRKIVAQLHDSKSKVLLSQISSTSNWFKKLDLYFQWLKTLSIEKQLYKVVDHVLVDSAEDAEYIRNLNTKNQVTVFPVGFDNNIYNLSVKPKTLAHKYNIVFTGSMSSMPTVDAARYILTKIMPSIWEEYPDTGVYLVGANPVKELNDFAKDNSKIHITGFVENLAEYLVAATVYLCPLRIGSGMKTRTIEALACGCPVVSSKDGISGLELSSDEEACWIEANSENEYIDGIKLLLDSVDYSNELRYRAAHYASTHYSWKVLSLLLLDIYTTVKNN